MYKKTQNGGKHFHFWNLKLGKGGGAGGAKIDINGGIQQNGGINSLCRFSAPPPLFFASDVNALGDLSHSMLGQG